MLARKSLIFLLSTLFIKGSEVIVFLIATNKYTKNEFGYLSVARSFFAFFIFFSDMNLNSTHIKKMSESIHPRNIYFSTYFILKIFLIPTMALVFVALTYFDPSLKTSSDSLLMNQILTILLISSILNSINMIFQGSFQAEMRVTRMQIGNVIGSLVKIILTFFIVLFVADFIYFVWLFFFYEAFSLCINVILCRGIRVVKVSKEIVKEYVRFGSIFFISTLMSVFYSNFGLLFLKDKLGVEALGVYYIVSRMVTFLSIIQSAFQAFLLPDISRNLKENNIQEIKRKTEMFQKYILVIWGCSSIMCFGLGVFLLELFGNVTQDQGLMLLFLEVIYMINTAWVPFRVLMVSQEDPKYLLITLFTLVFSIFSWIFLSSPLGIISIEFGRYLAFLPNTIIPVYLANKHYGFGHLAKSNIALILITIPFIAIELIFRVTFLPIIPAILLTMLFLGAYIGLLFFTRVLKKDDLAFIKRVLDPRKILKEIKTDLSG